MTDYWPIECHGCEHHNPCLADNFGACYEYCPTCIDAMQQAAGEMQALWLANLRSHEES